MAFYGITVSVAERVAFRRAVILTVLVERTLFVVTVKVAVVEPAATVTLVGTVATEVAVLERVTLAPPVGARPLSVTTPVDGVPPRTAVGLSESALRLGVLTVSEADRVLLL